jgi:2-hydroxy-3-keto-5-methylthiopentenyl-1-phosphate phosphatase
MYRGASADLWAAVVEIVGMRVICDFDGTVTRQDTTDWVLEHLADTRWRSLQDEWLAGRIDGAECMRSQVALIGGSDADLNAVLDRVELDPGFPDFVAWAEAAAIPVSIASDGVDYFIARILARYGFERLPVTTNRLAGAPGARRLDHPAKPPTCVSGSGVCKCAASEGDGLLVYVGDGRSDFCVSDRANILFAKGALADYAADRGRPYLAFDTFHDVRRALASLAEDRPAMLGEAASL